jgi:hypothetical protein
MQQTAQTPPKKTLLAAAVGILATLVVLALTAIAPADSVKTIGGVRGKAPPSCPTPKGVKGQVKNPQKVCKTMASVTGFQMVAHGKKAPMRVRQDGKIVAWSLELSKPTREERSSLTDGFDLGEPTAKLAVLKPQKKGKFKLTKQSPRVKITSTLGTDPIFTLKKPIRVSKGTVIGISTSSWVPNFAHDGALNRKGDKWRASRDSDKCGVRGTDAQIAQQLLAGKPQRKIGSVRRYGCTYTRARILYKAYYVPVKGKGGGGKGGK